VRVFYAGILPVFSPKKCKKAFLFCLKMHKNRVLAGLFSGLGISRQPKKTTFLKLNKKISFDYQ